MKLQLNCTVLTRTMILEGEVVAHRGTAGATVIVRAMSQCAASTTTANTPDIRQVIRSISNFIFPLVPLLA